MLKSFTDRGRVVFKMWFSPQLGAHSFETVAKASRIEGGPFSSYGSRLSAAHIRATVTMILCVEDSGSSRRNNQADPRRWNPENN
eukprot:9031817-Pyramimonas_sp.AAC.1